MQDAPLDLLNKLEQAGVKLSGEPVSVECVGNKVCVTTRGGVRDDVDVLYPALGCIARSELATSLNAVCDTIGNLQVDEHQRTSVAGLYAGDVVTDLHQISVATAHAAIAATDVHNSLASNYRQGINSTS